MILGRAAQHNTLMRQQSAAWNSVLQACGKGDGHVRLPCACSVLPRSASLFSVGSHATDLSRDLCSGCAVGSALGMGICGSAGGRTGQGTKGAAMHW